MEIFEQQFFGIDKKFTLIKTQQAIVNAIIKRLE